MDSDTNSDLSTASLALECLKSWFRLGIFTEEGLHTIVSEFDDGEGITGVD